MVYNKNVKDLIIKLFKFESLCFFSFVTIFIKNSTVINLEKFERQIMHVFCRHFAKKLNKNYMSRTSILDKIENYIFPK